MVCGTREFIVSIRMVLKLDGSSNKGGTRKFNNLIRVVGRQYAIKYKILKQLIFFTIILLSFISIYFFISNI